MAELGQPNQVYTTPTMCGLAPGSPDASAAPASNHPLPSDSQDAGRATTFKNPGAVLQAVETGVALVDRCHMGRLRITGPGRVAFAQQQFTSDVAAVKAGHGFETVRDRPGKGRHKGAESESCSQVAHQQQSGWRGWAWIITRDRSDAKAKVVTVRREQRCHSPCAKFITVAPSAIHAPVV